MHPYASGTSRPVARTRRASYRRGPAEDAELGFGDHLSIAKGGPSGPGALCRARVRVGRRSSTLGTVRSAMLWAG
eukprot:8205617-Pyramimonas_sp.AAC.1